MNAGSPPVKAAMSSHGYAAMWLVCGGAILLSLPPLLRLRQLAGGIIDPR